MMPSEQTTHYEAVLQAGGYEQFRQINKDKMLQKYEKKIAQVGG